MTGVPPRSSPHYVLCKRTKKGKFILDPLIFGPTTTLPSSYSSSKIFLSTPSHLKLLNELEEHVHYISKFRPTIMHPNEPDLINSFDTAIPIIDANPIDTVSLSQATHPVDDDSAGFSHYYKTTEELQEERALNMQKWFFSGMLLINVLLIIQMIVVKRRIRKLNTKAKQKQKNVTRNIEPINSINEIQSVCSESEAAEQLV